MLRTLASLTLVAIMGTEASNLRAALDTQKDDDWDIIGGGSSNGLQAASSSESDEDWKIIGGGGSAPTHEDIEYGDASSKLLKGGN